MAPKLSMGSFLAKLTGPKRARVTISPVSDHIFITGHGDEARGQFLRGKVSLFLPESQKVRGVQLKMVGRRWLGDHKAKTEDEVKWQTSETIVHQWDPFVVTDQIAQPIKNGKQYEWPFELFICGDQEESFKGCLRCSMTYLLEASAIQEDSLRSLYAFRPIRIIRSPSFSSYELMDPATVQGKWSGKAEYNVLSQAI
ncbi:hypothetical protein NW762_009308 [Fusarium torreyae]|uniref:Arrestin-like N-terminal domain-containing protein n=1 Tax=Fusarium torreyae TaxID=1237075 RepID=A0A9W8RUA3_9HYPO|nr:hypothetical protein NW762_009308 [Fusarium torreyae]